MFPRDSLCFNLNTQHSGPIDHGVFNCTKLNPNLTSIFHTNYFSIPISWEFYSKTHSYAADAR